jgi:hypothetical protein
MATDYPTSKAPAQNGKDNDLGFDPESPDVSDPAVDPTHPARTENDPVPAGEDTDEEDE